MSRENLLCTVVMTFSMYSTSLMFSSTQEPEEQCHQGKFHSCKHQQNQQHVQQHSANSAGSKGLVSIQVGGKLDQMVMYIRHTAR